MSQFSFGALESYRTRGQLLPVDGGFDVDGRLTRVAVEIEASSRPLPIGFWKGSGLALMLDLLAATLSGGKASHQIAPIPERENGQSQIFLAFDPATLGETGKNKIVDQIVEHFQLPPSSAGERVRYPGQRVRAIRKENMDKGIPVEPSVWQQIDSL